MAFPDYSVVSLGTALLRSDEGSNAAKQQRKDHKKHAHMYVSHLRVRQWQRQQ